MRIHTSAPTTVNDTAGTVIGSQTSIRDSKQDIGDYNDYSEALNMVLNAPLHTFRYKNEVKGYGENSPLAKIRIGYIADEVNPIFMVGNSIDQVSVNGLLMASVKELNLKIKKLEANNLSPDTESVAKIFGEYASLFFGNVVKKVEGGVVYMRGLVVDTLKIGSPEKRTGVTLYDEVTGEPYCISVASGIQKTTLGECIVVEIVLETSSSISETKSSSISEEDGGGEQIIIDTIPPVITLNGSSEMTLIVGDAYVEQGASAVDNKDGETMIVTSGLVDINIIGIYTVTYDASDSTGNKAVSVKRTVTVSSGTTLAPASETTS